MKCEIVSPQAAALGLEATKVFGPSGGTIGRRVDNDWVLPDPYVSGCHARIHWCNRQFFLEDASSNGIFINSPDRSLAPGERYPISSGDRIFIEAYEIHVTLTSSAAEFAGLPAQASHAQPPSGAVDPTLVPNDPFGTGDSSRAPAPQHERSRQLIPEALRFDTSAAGCSATTSVDLLQLVGIEPRPPLAIASPPELAPRGPTLPAAAQSIPDACERGLDDVSSTQPQQAPQSPSDFAAMLAGAGLPGVQVTPELVESFGRLLRIVVAGLMDVLQARQQIKSEFRMSMTSVKSADNNPLKFSANIDDALYNLFVRRSKAFLDTEDAFVHAFAEVRNHQAAMLAGMHAAFDAMLDDFDPERLEETFDRQAGKGLLLRAFARPKYWDLYRDRFHEQFNHRASGFRELFGDEFARAYEEQLERLRSIRAR